MLETIIVIFAFYALTYAIKESILFDKIRIFLIRLHPFFYHLFSCYYCCGWWAGLFVYYLANNEFHLKSFFLWGFAGSGISYIMNLLADVLIQKSHLETNAALLPKKRA